MFNRLALVAALTFGAMIQVWPNMARTQERLVVVELFTSQGCSRCPPADALIGEISQWADVLPLSLHVDYWDFIGWKDNFALKSNTERQTAYAPRTQRRRLFTPLMVVGGVHMVEGYTPMEVVEHIGTHRKHNTGVRLAVEQTGAELIIRAEAARALGVRATILLVTYSPQKRVLIERGENAGRRAVYTNVVTGWQVLSGWDGVNPLMLTHPAPTQSAAILVQSEGQGRMLAAARLR